MRFPFLCAATTILLALSNASGQATPSVLPPDQGDAYVAIAVELNVNDVSGRLSVTPTRLGVQMINEFSTKWPESPYLEELLYVRAMSQWSLFEYAAAADSYALFLSKWPQSDYFPIANQRNIQSLLRSDQTQAALDRLNAYSNTSQFVVETKAIALADLERADEAVQLLLEALASETQWGSERRIRDRLAEISMIGKPLPPFSVPVLGGGQIISSTDFAGKVLLIDFWATWCKPCMAAMGLIRTTYNELHPRGFEIFGVSLDEDLGAVQAAHRRFALTWPEYFDGLRFNNELAKKYGVSRIPSNILVDQSGIVRGVNLPAAAIKRRVEAMLPAIEPATPQAPATP
jgi:thiol-disulfide isomerase/thioredoxin